MKIIIIIISLLQANWCYSQYYASEEDSLAHQVFNQWLEDCPENEIRCLWYHEGNYRTAMKMQIELFAFKVSTVRDVYDFARQAFKERDLSRSQIENLNDIVKNLPDSTGTALTNPSLYVSYKINGIGRVKTYNRYELPNEIQRIYDIGGGYIDTSQN